MYIRLMFGRYVCTYYVYFTKTVDKHMYTLYLLVPRPFSLA